MTCSRCGAPYLAADPECPRCGLPLTPSITPVVTSSIAPAASHRSWPRIAGVAAVGLVAVVLALHSFGGDDDDPSADPVPSASVIVDPTLPTSGSSSTRNPLPAGTNLATGAAITADDTAPPGVDDANNPVDYGTSNLADGDLSTAWRAPGFYNGKSITILLPEKSSIQVVGLTNGYTKQDASSGADRYEEGRRITSVTWTFDNGKSIHQDLEDGVRTIQRIKIDPVQATKVTLRVDQTTTPGHFTSDFTAISEIFLGSTPP
jgi:hypothetical protein